MTNEIKEILDDLDFYVNHTKDWVEPLGFNQSTWKELLDYITNLQEENEKQHKGFLAVCEEAKDLEQRIDKAIDYIFSNKEFYYGDDLLDEYNEIVDILRGDE